MQNRADVSLKKRCEARIVRAAQEALRRKAAELQLDAQAVLSALR